MLDTDHPNCLEPRKRPYHTIIPALATDSASSELFAVFGVMGGFMQPQGQVQVLSNMVDHGMDVQRALDVPRFCFQRDNLFNIEPFFPDALYADLQRRGHSLTVTESGGYGGGQVIMVDPESGALLAGSEPRKDGCAVAY